ncbi:MAG TPA: AAA family ATPase [Noviherbaspirillum sp.]|jgi:type II secretory pathway predicted ATPase ExeA|uniref:ExeA family protein n=1 Tax=Noviherbaspirillum sp. TaxID=1926288 RepID=UPI002F956B87
MYLSHFGLNEPPFGITPNPAFFYAGGKRGDILDALLYAVSNGAGIVKVTGEVGSGKTMLCRMLESMLPESVEVIYLVNPTLARDQVVYAIAAELGLDTSGKRPDEMIRILQADLIAKHARGRQVVLLIEEAQAMPLETLEEIRLFSNLETARDKLLQIVLFGQPELDDNLGLARMRQLKERITQGFTMPPLRRESVPEFLMFRMRAAGYRGPNIFSSGAARLIADVSEGVVRRISILADKALLAAFADDKYSVSERHVRAAIADSEFAGRAGSVLRRRALTGAAAAALLAAGVALPAAAWQWWPRAAAPAPSAAPAQPATVAAVAAPATAPAATEPAQATVAADVKPVSAKPPAAPAAASLLERRLQATEAWLDSEDNGRYSLQLNLMQADDAQVERFLRKLEGQTGLDQVYVYRTRLGATDRVGITYGSFAAREQARAEIEKVREAWGYRAQLRTVGGLKSEIARAGSAA